MTFEVYAITRHEGPVVLRSFETKREQTRFYGEARQKLVSGGFDPDVADIALGPTAGREAEDANEARLAEQLALL